MARKRLPGSGHAIVPDATTGKMDFTWYKMQKRQARETQAVSDSVDTATTNVTSLSSDSRGAFIEYPDAKSYTLWQRIPFAGTIDRTTVKTSAGTATVTVKINGVAVGGAAHSASSTEESIARTTTNTFAAGDDFVITVSAVSSAENLAVSIDYTRTMA